MLIISRSAAFLQENRVLSSLTSTWDRFSCRYRVEDYACLVILSWEQTATSISLARSALSVRYGWYGYRFAFKTGKTWFEVPATIKIVIKGELKPPLTAKDLTLFIVKHFGASGALGKAIEFYGEAIDSLTLDGRITLSSMVTEMWYYRSDPTGQECYRLLQEKI